MIKDRLLLLILCLGFGLRILNLNWDANFHLHPDERFLTMVGNAMKIPKSLGDYLDPQQSTFNPTNIGYKFYVYGLFPLTLNKIAAVILGNDNYNAFTIQGRLFSAIADAFIILLIFKTLRLFEKQYQINKEVKYWGSFLYAIAVLPIQLSHFFAVDSFLNLFMFASFYFALKLSFEKENNGSLRYLFSAALFFFFWRLRLK